MAGATPVRLFARPFPQSRTVGLTEIGARSHLRTAQSTELAWELMEHRYQLFVNGRASETDFEPLMASLDDFADFRANYLDWYVTIKQKGDPTRPPVLAKAASIARKGRSARVHLLFATQRPDAAFFDGGDMRQLPGRHLDGRLSPQGDDCGRTRRRAPRFPGHAAAARPPSTTRIVRSRFLLRLGPAQFRAGEEETGQARRPPAAVQPPRAAADHPTES